MVENLVVTIENGKIKGKTRKDYHGGKLYSFSGIPYAKAPVGELRFQAPKPPECWEGIRDGTKEGPEAPSMHLTPKIHVGREDNCLNLNVYTKELPKNGVSKKFPVMMFVHGGGFVIGSNKKLMFGPRYLLTEEIVLVIINYRLGVLGFLSLEDPSLEVPGNAGLKDQVMALKWIQKNIIHFGGDPNNVTVFGESAGSASVHYLTLSPLTKGLFHKAIMQSGTALNPWAKGRKNGAIIAKQMGYDPELDEKTLLGKLRRASAKSLMNAQFKFVDTLTASIIRPYVPVVEHPHEGAFICEEPIDIMKAGKHHDIPMIIGYTSSEGLLHEIMRRVTNTKLSNSLEEDIPFELDISEESDTAKKIADEMKQFYFNDKDLSKKNFNIRSNLFSDVLFLHGIQRTIALLKENGTAPIYVYKMSVFSNLNFLTHMCCSNHVRTVAIVTIFMKISGKTSFKNMFKSLHKKLMVKKVDGVSHGDDQFYLFNNMFLPKVVKGSDEDLYIQRFVKLWTTFSNSGDPTPEQVDVLNNIKWNPVKDENIDSMLDIGNTLQMTKNMEYERVKFWEKVYQKYAT